MKELDNIANQLADLRGRRQENNTLKQIVYILESEVVRAFGIKLPYDMTNGRGCIFLNCYDTEKISSKEKSR